MYADLNALQAHPPVTVSSLAKMKQEGRKIASLTAYDASFAQAVDLAGVDLVLVGDSLGMVVQGVDSTIPVSVDDMVYHSKAVARGLHRAFLMVDLPFMSYATVDQAIVSSARLMQEGGAKMVKLEGGAQQADVVAYLAERGVPVCGHIGLRPQSVHKLGGYKVQGRNQQQADIMRADAQAMVDAGVDVLLMECVPSDLAAEITGNCPVPVIGIGAGPEVDGQILVLHDVLNVTPGRKPKFVKNFMGESNSIHTALTGYVDAVQSQSFPAPEHCFS